MIKNRAFIPRTTTVSSGCLEIVPSGDPSFIEEIHAYPNKGEVFFIHILSNGYLEAMTKVDDGQGIKNMVAAIAAFHNLKFVVVGGFTPLLLLEKLVYLDLKAVIVSTRRNDLAKVIQKKVTSETTLPEILGEFASTTLPFHQVTYHLEHDSLYWKTRPTWGREAPIGIYSLQPLPEDLSRTFSKNSGPHPVGNTGYAAQRRGRTLRFLLASGVILLACILFIYIFSQLEAFWAKW